VINVKLVYVIVGYTKCMVNPTRQDPICAMIEHRSEAPIISRMANDRLGVVAQGLTVAELRWPLSQPEDTYTIGVGRDLSIEFDRHFPIRPSGVTLQAANWNENDALILQYFGEEFSDAMKQARKQGMVIIEFTLGQEQRVGLRDLQVESPSTPWRLRQACGNLALGGAAGLARPCGGVA
jgi:hypothetical protein